MTRLRAWLAGWALELALRTESGSLHEAAWWAFGRLHDVPDEGGWGEDPW